LGSERPPNGWADKEWGLLLPPFTNVAVALLFAFRRAFDSWIEGYGLETRASLERVLKMIRLATSTFLTAMALLIDTVALGWKLDVLRLVTLGMLVLFAVMGNFLPKLRPNRFVGIRTPWTLKSPEVWTRTHRLFGAIMLIGSLALMFPCVLMPSSWSILFLIGFILFISIGSMVYSYICHQSLA
jgi:uncharacterized membrane protein